MIKYTNSDIIGLIDLKVSDTMHNAYVKPLLQKHNQL